MQKWSFEKLPFSGAYFIKHFFSYDLRGGFIEGYSKEVFYTISRRGAIRALHFQEVNQQPKLVRCVSGKIFDAIVDLCPDSPTFKKWMGFYLTSENMHKLLFPKRFAHGYLVIEDSIVLYKCAAPFDKANDSGIMFDDPDIGVVCPFEEIGGIK